jgi:hypothetical protein
VDKLRLGPKCPADGGIATLAKMLTTPAKGGIAALFPSGRALPFDPMLVYPQAAGVLSRK